MHTKLKLLLPLMLLAGCATSAEQADRRERDAGAAVLDATGNRYADGATKTGAAEDCIPLTSIRSTRVRGDQVIDFEVNGRKTYRNVLPNSCPQLGFEERFAYKTSLAQLCSVDVITVLQSPGLSRGATCGLGRFQPIDRPVR